MWLVICDQTGEEVWSFEKLSTALSYAKELEEQSTWAETFDIRWEN